MTVEVITLKQMAERQDTTTGVCLRRIQRDDPECWQLIETCSANGQVTKELFNHPTIYEWSCLHILNGGRLQQLTSFLNSLGFHIVQVDSWDLSRTYEQTKKLGERLCLGVGRKYHYFNYADTVQMRGGPENEWLYLIRARTTHRYKIGYSQCVKDRLASLRGASPLPLDLIAARNGTRATEATLHYLLKDYRIHGEWFEHPDRGSITRAFLDGLPNLRKEVL